MEKARLGMLAVLLLAGVCIRTHDLAAGGQEEDASAGEAAMTELEKQFAEKLSGAVLVGTYTVDGKTEDRPPRPERYEIERVSKLRDDYWTIVARIQYGEQKEQSVPVPVTLKVLWAGDTPVMTLTDLTVPGFGTFTARVLIHGDRYVGTWQHGDVGGHMWGHVEQGDEPSQQPPEAPKP